MLPKRITTPRLSLIGTLLAASALAACGGDRRFALRAPVARETDDQIAKPSGHKVEATRNVDPDLIGGVVLD